MAVAPQPHSRTAAFTALIALATLLNFCQRDTVDASNVVAHRHLSRPSRPPPSLDNREVIAALDDTARCTTIGRLKDDCFIAATPTNSSNSSSSESDDARRSDIDANRCLLVLWRSAEASGCSNDIVAPYRNRSEAAAAPPRVSMPLCPCARKKIVTVHAVSITVSILEMSSGHFSIEELMAVTQTLPTDSDSVMGGSATTTMDGSRPFYLIDVSTSRFVFLSCKVSEARVVKQSASPLGRQLSRLRLQLPLNLSTNADFISRVASSPQASKDVAVRSCSWCCTTLRKHPLSTYRESEQQPPPSVFYSFDSFSAAGHAMEEMIHGIGQYVTQGLHAQQVPWLVPCSDDWGYFAAPSRGKRAPWLWTEFFAELNEALQFPFYPVDFKHFHVDSPQFSPLVFGTVHFAVPSVGYNSLCYKKVVQHFLWPHAVRLAAKRGWDADAEHRFQEVLKTSAMPPSALPTPPVPAASLSAVSAPLLWKTNHRIAMMKIVPDKNSSSNISSIPTAAFKTPGRGYTFSDHFEHELVQRGILSMNPTLPLFERMWHANNAELIVTTWGSTLAVLINVLFERQQQVDDGAVNFTSQTTESHVRRAAVGDSTSRSDDDDDDNDSLPQRPLRVLILVHPEYIAETEQLFQKTSRFLQDPQHMPTSFSSNYTLYSKVSRHRMPRAKGALSDFYGGRDFCAKYVLVHKLDFVGRELDFRC
ncbi:Hypothetical protein, putative [Bodo saltans]|uniref:Membrane-associated protein n=1 Tax=Bodo saltans TaxID=75058 RepID=A0A0S4INC4_BODSA|nr:Hypothetical protein, putative [Bodo saltans]|eukprot:CUE64060.1 Hypothetical protein, putative [Bodo saltans]